MPPAAPLKDFLLDLTDHPVVRRLAWLGFVSWVVALTLTGYVFGFTEGFFGRWLSATLVLWLLAAGTTFGIIPGIRWLTRRLSDSGGRAPRPRKAAPKRPLNRPTHSPSSAIPANKWR
ncbi:MAG: DUF2798 domain-containing protein [Hymenobacteraceae bacterium]|nr:DUF2798 domain-containing protein [Hymenobacteraceae bacterium]